MVAFYEFGGGQPRPAGTEEQAPVLVVVDPFADLPLHRLRSYLELIAAWPDCGIVLAMSTQPLDDDAASLAGLAPIDLALTREYRVVIPRLDAATTLATDIISILLTLRISRIYEVCEVGTTAIYRRPETAGAGRVLFVFPGMFAPPDIGSHQRACATVLALMDAGFNVDILVSGPSRPRFRRSLKFLRLMTARPVYFATRPLLADTGPRAQGRRDTGVPATIAERQAANVTPEGRDIVRHLLARHRYDGIVVSFVWMLALVEGLDIGAARLVCDTHDVHSYRLEGHNGHGASPHFDIEDERRREVALLGSTHSIIAISERDAELFRGDLGLPQARFLPLRYPAAAWPGRARSLRKPLRFGFIGTRMHANRLALAWLVDQWWPTIRQFAPDSILQVAGTVCESRTVQDLAVHDARIEILGHVSSATAFFADIDILLSPALVPGGLNIKIVESLLSHRPVITNALGAAPLRPLELPTECETADHLLDILASIDGDAGFNARLGQAYSIARTLFGDGAHATGRAISFWEEDGSGRQS